MLLIFCTAEMSSLLPYAQYYLNYDYIAEVLCINKEKPMTLCYGKCYLNEQLEKANAADETTPPAQEIKWEKQPLVFSDTEPYHLQLGLQHQGANSVEQKLPLKNRYSKPPTPPPQC